MFLKFRNFLDQFFVVAIWVSMYIKLLSQINRNPWLFSRWISDLDLDFLFFFPMGNDRWFKQDVLFLFINLVFQHMYFNTWIILWMTRHWPLFKVNSNVFLLHWKVNSLSIPRNEWLFNRVEWKRPFFNFFLNFFWIVLKSCRRVWWTRIPKEKKTKNIFG